MPDIFEFLSPLHQGIWEVVIPKSILNLPLGPEWKVSKVNVPSPGTINSYRNGQYHAHETESEIKVHLDRYDPKKNPILHLIDDAPLVLMIYETLETIYVTNKDARKNDKPAFLRDQQMTWKIRMGIGLVLICIAISLSLIAMSEMEVIFSIILPVLVIFGGLIMLLNGFVMRSRGDHTLHDIFIGLILVICGFFIFFTWKLVVLILFLILAIWFISSAIVTILRLFREKKSGIQRKSLFSLGIGICSLIFGVYTIFAPEDLTIILTYLLSLVILLIGVAFFMDGYGMYNVEKLMRQQRR